MNIKKNNEQKVKEINEHELINELINTKQLLEQTKKELDDIKNTPIPSSRKIESSNSTGQSSLLSEKEEEITNLQSQIET